MLKRILIYLAIFIAISLVILWIVTGGIGKIAKATKTLIGAGEGTSTGAFFRLPWQPEEFSLGPDVSSLLGEYGADDSSGTQNTEDELRSLQEEYDTLDEAARAARNFGTPSPYRDEVYIEIYGVTEEGVNTEYLTLTAAWDNTTPVDITGWSLQSALSGVRAYIPRGANNFLMGTVNEQKSMQLNPGASGTVVSGQSPVGTSFRENICSGYLNQMQEFSPRLEEKCPAPTEVLPLTAENLSTYGDTCIDFARTLPSCYAPLQSLTPELSMSCRNFLADKLSYNGCADMYRHRASFMENSWRIYLGASHELWRNSHDVIRLLDAEGKTVDAITY